MNVLLTGLVMGESARWHEGRLWFCDWGAGEVIRLDDRTPTVELRMAGLPFCIDWLPDGRMLITTAGRLLRREPDGTLVTHAELPSPHPWNEVAVDRHGTAYVNNIGYDFPGGTPAPGFITAVTADGTVLSPVGELQFPNGMIVVGDRLIVAESHASQLTAFDISPDGILSGQRVWASVPGSAPDGICADPTGAIWYADVPNQQCVLVREGGEVVRTVALDRGGFSCALDDTGTLYAVTADYANLFTARTGQLVAIHP